MENTEIKEIQNTETCDLAQFESIMKQSLMRNSDIKLYQNFTTSSAGAGKQSCSQTTPTPHASIHLINATIELYDKIDDPILNRIGYLIKEAKRYMEGDLTVDLNKVNQELTDLSREQIHSRVLMKDLMDGTFTENL